MKVSSASKHQRSAGSRHLTDSVARLPADGRRALDVRPGGGHVVVPAQLGQEVLDQVDEDQVPAGHDQVTQSHDGPLKEPQLQISTQAQTQRRRRHSPF